MRMIVAIAALFMMTLMHTPAAAQSELFDAQEEAVEKPSGGSRTVTPISKCLEQLPEADAIEVRANYLKPYQECHRRLQTLKRQEATDKATEKTSGRKSPAKKAAAEDDEEETETAKDPGPAEDARNFVRVRKDNSPRQPTSRGKTVEPAAEKPVFERDRGALYNR